METISLKVKYWEDAGQKETFIKLDLVPNSDLFFLLEFWKKRK